MQDLRLVGVHDDGTHLLLSGAGGEMFQLPIDEALRTASRPAPRPASERPAIPLSPRDIQARIRAGETPEQVAAAAQTSLERVMPYAAPVLAEREHVAERAQRSSVRRASGEGSGPSRTLGDAITAHLHERNVDPEVVAWRETRG